MNATEKDGRKESLEDIRLAKKKSDLGQNEPRKNMSPMDYITVNDEVTETGTQGTLHLQRDVRLSQVYAKKAAPLNHMNIPRTFSTSS